MNWIHLMDISLGVQGQGRLFGLGAMRWMTDVIEVLI